MINLTDLSGRTAIVTGAGAGVGRGIGIALAQAGASVVIAARRAENGEPVAQEIVKAGGRALFVRTDVSQRSDVEACVAKAVATFGGLDIMVHNAISGRSTERTPVQDISEAALDEVIAVAITGSLHCARAALPHFKKDRGRYIALLAHGGFRGHPSLAMYGISKGMERGFVKSLAWEFGAHGVTVNSITPFAMSDGMRSYYEKNPAAYAAQTSRLPLGYIGEPDRDVGGAAVFLASDAARYITGQVIFADGGNYFP